MKRVAVEVEMPKLDLVDLDPLLVHMVTKMMTNLPNELVPYVYHIYDSYQADW